MGVGVAANNVEYFDEPAMAVMLCDVPPEHYRLFSGVSPLPAGWADTALVHADPHTPDLAELIDEVAERTQQRYLFGGLTASRTRSVQFSAQAGRVGDDVLTGGGVLQGGLSGVAFSAAVGLLSRVTQGCQPVSAEREVTEAEGHVLTDLTRNAALDGVACLVTSPGIPHLYPSPHPVTARALEVGVPVDNDIGLGRRRIVGLFLRHNEVLRAFFGFHAEHYEPRLAQGHQKSLGQKHLRNTHFAKLMPAPSPPPAWSKPRKGCC